MKLAQRLTILFIFLAVTPSLIMGYIAYENGRSTLNELVSNHLVSTNLLKRSELNRWINDNKLSLEALAQRPLVKKYAAVLTAQDETSPAYSEAMVSLLNDHLLPGLVTGSFSELFILNPLNGVVMISSNTMREGKSRNNEPYFIEGKNRTYLYGVYFSTVLNQPALTIGTPIKDENGNLIAVLAGRMDLGVLSGIMSLQTGLSGSEDTYLVNSANLFVTEPRFGKDYALKQPVHTEAVEAGLKGNESVAFYPDYRNEPVIGAYKWLPEYQMVLITEVDQSEAYAPLHRVTAVRAGIMSIVLLIAIVACYLAARAITRPLRRLVKGIEEVGRGNLDYRVGIPDRDEIGELSRSFDSMTQDLKATTVSRDELVKSEKKYRDIFNNAVEGIFQSTPQGQYLSVNPAFARMYGFASPEEMIAGVKDIQKQLYVHEEDRVRIKELLKDPGTVNDFVAEFVGGDGRNIWASINAQAVRDREGKVIYYQGTTMDITERKKAVEEIQRLNVELEQRVLERTAQLEATNRELEAFSYSVSHDLRAPLRAIDGYTRILLEDYLPKLDDEGRRICSVITSSAHNMQTLIDDLLAFSRMGRSEMHLSRVDMGTLANSIYYELTTEETRQRIDFQVDNIPPAMVDPTLIRQVWINLISNAIKFSSHKERAVIRISGRAGSTENFYSVMDNGAGFDMQYTGKLFGVFQRLHSTKEFEGNGVGLAIVQRVVNRHGGRVWALGEIDQGAIFDFTLPREGGPV